MLWKQLFFAIIATGQNDGESTGLFDGWVNAGETSKLFRRKLLCLKISQYQKQN